MNLTDKFEKFLVGVHAQFQGSAIIIQFQFFDGYNPSPKVLGLANMAMREFTVAPVQSPDFTLDHVGESRGELVEIGTFFQNLARDSQLFVFYDAKPQLQFLESLGIDTSQLRIHDLRVAEGCLHLGVDSIPLNQLEGIPKGAPARNSEFRLSFDAICDRYIDHPLSKPSVMEKLAEVFLLQQEAIREAGLQQYLEEVEFPFTVANASMEWAGVMIDKARLGVLRNLLSQRSGESNEEDIYRQWSKPLRISKRGSRLRPIHIQNGSPTGRSSCRYPALGSLKKKLRPIVVAPEGFALVEFDWCQFEAALLGAKFDDPDLIKMYRYGDVYAQLARIFFQPRDVMDFALTPEEFAIKYPQERSKAGTLFYQLCYGASDKEIAMELGVRKSLVPSLREKFEKLFPNLIEGISKLPRSAKFVNIALGLRRFRPDRKLYGNIRMRRSVHLNTPMQGLGAIVLKRAHSEVFRHFAGTGIKVVFSLHDCLLLEIPLNTVKPVIAEVEQIMVQSASILYPELKLRVKVNTNNLSFWNDGKVVNFNVENLTR